MLLCFGFFPALCRRIAACVPLLDGVDIRIQRSVMSRPSAGPWERRRFHQVEDALIELVVAAGMTWGKPQLYPWRVSIFGRNSTRVGFGDGNDYAILRRELGAQDLAKPRNAAVGPCCVEMAGAL